MRLTSEDFVDALYRGLFDRAPDSAGFAHHAAVIEAGSSPAVAIEMVRAFAASEEFRLRRNPAELLAAATPTPSGPAFDHVASLGSHCYASTVLKTMGLKRYSLPFDWIFSSLPMVAHCIEDGFTSFLDPTEYRSNPPHTRPEPGFGLCDHALYRRDFGVGAVFNHYDPNEPIHHAYLVRAVGRFTRLLASPARKLFLAVVRIQQPTDLVPPFIRLAQVLQEHTTNFELRVLAVLPNGGIDDFSHAVLHRRANHTLSVLQPLSPMLAIQFGDPFDEVFVRRLIAAHRFALAAAI